MSFPETQVGPYTLIRLLGRGGFGEVWLAERRSELVTTKFAVKLPLGSAVDLATIKQEATIWAHVSGHPNVLPIIEANIYDGQVVIVSEYAPDGSLDDWLQSNPFLPVSQSVEMILGILNGLEFLHSRQIIHRDLKPANILLQGSIPRLADFGISRAAKATNISSAIMGTPAFMAPEAFDGKRNEQTDLWSVGVILHLLLAGRLPFLQANMSELIAAIMWREAEPLPATIPPALRSIVARALTKNPDERYRSVADMRNDLQRAASSFSAATDRFSATGVRTLPLPANADTDPTAVPTVASLAPPVPQSQPRAGAVPVKSRSARRALLIGATTLVLLLFIAGAVGVGIYSFARALRNIAAHQPATKPTENLLVAGPARDLFTKLDKENGPLKMHWIVVYENEMYVIVHDAKIDENYDRYTYKNGEFKKEPESSSIREYWNHKEFSLSEVNLDVWPNVMKAATEKAQTLEGGKVQSIEIVKGVDSQKDKVGKIEWGVYINGARKDLHLTFDGQANLIKEIH